MILRNNAKPKVHHLPNKLFIDYLYSCK